MLDKHFRLSKTTKRLMAHPINQERSSVYKALMIKAESSRSKERVIISKPTDKE
jgi:hypothetical protein